MVAKLDDYLRFNEAALDLRAQRQQVLASNIANADTPNFKARDINFAKTLQDVLGQQQSSVNHFLRSSWREHRQDIWLVLCHRTTDWMTSTCYTVLLRKAVLTVIPSTWMSNVTNLPIMVCITRLA